MNYIDLHYPHNDPIYPQDWKDYFNLSFLPEVTGTYPNQIIRIRFADDDCLGLFTRIYTKYSNERTAYGITISSLNLDL